MKKIQDISEQENDYLYEMVKISRQYYDAGTVHTLRNNLEKMFKFNDAQWEFVKTMFEEDLKDQYDMEY